MESPAMPGSEQSSAFGGTGEVGSGWETAEHRKSLDENLDGEDASMTLAGIDTNSSACEENRVNEMVPPELNGRERELASESGCTSPQDREPKNGLAYCGQKSAAPGPISGDAEGFLNFGGGLLADGEELGPSTSDQRIHCPGCSRFTARMDNSVDSKGSNGHVRSMRSREKSIPRNSECALRTQDSVPEIVKQLSEPLGMAVATVFYEVLEQGEFSDTCGTHGDELSRLLEAALKESLRNVLGNSRSVFVEGFRNAFRGTFKTRRSVSRAFVQSRGRIGRSREVSTSRGKSIRSDGLSKMRESNVSLASSPGTRKQVKAGANVESKSHIEQLGKRRSSSCLRTAAEDEDELCDSMAGSGRDGDCDESIHSSGESCLDVSLQSYFFTDSNGEETDSRHTEDEFEMPESCNTKCWHEGSMSDPRRCAEDVQSESPLSQPTPDARDIRRERPESEDSDDQDVFYSSSSNEAEHFRSVDEGGTREASSRNCDDSPQSSASHKSRQASVGDERRRPSGFRKSSTLLDRGRASSNGSGNGSPADFRVGGAGTSSPQVSNHNVAKRLAKRSDTRRRRPRKVVIVDEGPTGAKSGISGTGKSSSAGVGEESCEEPEVLVGEHNSERMLVPVISQRVHMGRALTLPVEYDTPVQTNYALSSRYVAAMEDLNRLKYLEIDQIEKRMAMKVDHLSLQSETNSLMRETVDIGRSKIELKEHELEHRELRESCQKLSQDCADELVAGLCLMLVAICFSTWKFSFKRLSKIVEICQQPAREPRTNGWFGTNWMSNSMDSVSWQMKAVTCKVTKAGRMTAGLVVIAIVATVLFRRNVTSYSQAMPVTIIVVVLAGLCGLAGKISIDSLGGSGIVWVVLWETLCFLHVVGTSFTPWLHHYLYGPPSRAFSPRKPTWLQLCSISARFFFHSCLVFGLPVMAGLLPFATVEELIVVFQKYLEARNESDLL